MSENDASLKIDARVEITCDPSGKYANMFIHAPVHGGKEATYDMVMEQISKCGITVNIDEVNIKKVIHERIYNLSMMVANAIMPKKGANGYVSYRFDKEHQHKLKPHQNEFGIADYRELNSIVPIHKNDVIADIVLPTEGTPGMNIYGQELPAEPGEPTKAPLGKNTLLTTDGTKIVAACDGHLIFGNGCFQVEEAVVIKTDVDVSVGNISFFGDIHIKGNVMEGFTINAGKNIKIDGSVFSAEVVAGGDVTIVGGCINSKVTCDGNADIGFCENAEIFAKGDLVSKQFAFCNAFCYGALTAKTNTGVILGGKVTSMHDITAGIIGSSKYTPTEVYIGDGSVLFLRKREAEADLKESMRIFDSAIKNLTFLKQRKIAQGGELTDAQKQQYRQETQNKLLHALRKTELQAVIDKLDEDIKNKDALSAKCGTIYPGVKFTINFLTLEIPEVTVRSRVTIIDDKLAIVPM